jgi:hypothetical protein
MPTLQKWKNKCNMRATQIHYENGQGYDIIDVCKDYSLNFNRGNILKYVARAGKKQDELQDLRKALDRKPFGRFLRH